MSVSSIYVPKAIEKTKPMPDALLNTLRARLLFCVDGLPLRDELVIKSLVRLLDHRTHHHWIYSPDKADLKMIGNTDGDVASGSESATTAEYILRVGRIKEHDGPFLSLPVNSNELELVLNDLGIRISESKRDASAAPNQAASSNEFSLLRWPSAALLTGPERTKLATLIMGRFLSAAELAQRANVSMHECTSYLQELQANGYLVVNVPGSSIAQNPADTAQPVKEKVATGLLSRIRSRLGLK